MRETTAPRHVSHARLVLTGFLLAIAGLAVAGAVLGWRLASHGVSARDPPTAIETAAARFLRHLATPAGARDAANPVASSPELLEHAGAHFADHCATCHGNDGRGETTMGRRMYPRPPDMRQKATQDLTDGEIFWIIKNGVRLTGMPAWGEDNAEDDRASWELVRFIRHIPELTPAEVERMRALNPVSPGEADEGEGHEHHH